VEGNEVRIDEESEMVRNAKWQRRVAVKNDVASSVALYEPVETIPPTYFQDEHHVRFRHTLLVSVPVVLTMEEDAPQAAVTPVAHYGKPSQSGLSCGVNEFGLSFQVCTKFEAELECTQDGEGLFPEGVDDGVEPR
jgi:hypothetical protein